MKILRFFYKEKERWGVLQGEDVNILNETPFGSIKRSNKKIALKKVRILAPSCPSKIVLAGLNYIDHARELNMKIPKHPIIFLKPATSLVAHKENIIYPNGVKRLDYEGELALVIKKRCKDISTRFVKDYILGSTCLNDVTARDLQSQDIQWTRSKSFDTFCPVGPFIENEADPNNLNIKTYLNNNLKQNSSTRNFIFSAYELVAFISGIMTLLPGDIVSTGTPFGVGPMKKNDLVEVDISGVGKLTNRVV